ncbi:MAG: HIT family protein [Dechloromonas sp.]|nr:HIT family protein [Dechloromonas sp.]
MSETGRCELCSTTAGELLWSSPACRIVLVNEADYPGFCRVIWTAHVREMSDLSTAQQQALMAVVFAVEAVLRQLYDPLKINLASFGNMVPHLHWHIIPRWADDPHFPEPIWGRRQRDSTGLRPKVSAAQLAAAMQQALAALPDLPQ